MVAELSGAWSKRNRCASFSGLGRRRRRSLPSWRRRRPIGSPVRPAPSTAASCRI